MSDPKDWEKHERDEAAFYHPRWPSRLAIAAGAALFAAGAIALLLCVFA